MNSRIAAVASILMILCFAWADCQADDAGRWYGDLDEARKIARESGRPMVILVTSRNCRYCLKMEQETLSDAAVVTDLDANFVAVKINASQQRRVARKLGASSYPTTIFIGSNSRELDTVHGFLDADQFRAHLQQTTSARH